MIVRVAALKMQGVRVTRTIRLKSLEYLTNCRRKSGALAAINASRINLKSKKEWSWRNVWNSWRKNCLSVQHKRPSIGANRNNRKQFELQDLLRRAWGVPISDVDLLFYLRGWCVYRCAGLTLELVYISQDLHHILVAMFAKDSQFLSVYIHIHHTFLSSNFHRSPTCRSTNHS